MSEHWKYKPKQRSRHRGRVDWETDKEKRILQKKARQAGGNKKESGENWGTTGRISLWGELYVWWLREERDGEGFCDAIISFTIEGTDFSLSQ